MDVNIPGGIFMKRTTIAILTFSMIFLITLSGNPAFGASKALTDEIDFNAGDLPQGTVIVHDFIFKNTGSEPLTLKVTSCTCGGVKYETPSAIQPGKTDKIRVSIPTKYLKGGYKKDILVQTNDPEKKEIHFTIQANIKGAVSTAP
jgi:hypothetical protein